MLLFSLLEVGCSHDIGHDDFTSENKEIVNGLEVNWMYQLPNEKREALRLLLNDMIKVEGGVFVMGATQEQSQDARLNEYPAHAVRLSSFYICRKETSTALVNALWGTKLGSTYTKFTWEDWFTFIKDLRTMTGLEFDFPTEAQWEYAAKGGNKSKGYLYSGSNNVNDVAGCLTNRNYEGPKPVKTKSPNELGLYDMTGNVDEWCQDWYSTDYFCISPSKDPPGPPSGKFRVCRGCNWQHCWVICRGKSTPEYRSDHTGFRLSIIHN